MPESVRLSRLLLFLSCLVFLLGSVPHARAQETFITFLGVWDRSQPLLERAARETGHSVRFLPGTVSEKELARLTEQSGVVLVLNIRPRTARALKGLLATTGARGPRFLELDRRDGHAGLLEGGHLEPDPKIGAYWRANGLVNMKRLLDYVAVTYLGAAGKILPPAAVPPRGFYRPGVDEAVPTLEELAKVSPWHEGSPRAAMLIQQSFWITHDVQVIDAVTHALEKEGFDVAIMFSDTQAWLENAIETFRPDILIEDRHGSLWEGRRGAWLEKLGAPYLRPISMLAYTVEQWLADPQGLAVRDRSHFMALQELNGTIEPIVVGGLAHDIRGFRLHRPIPERVRHFARRARKWADLRRTPPAERKVALIYYNKYLGKSDLFRGSPTGAFLDIPRSLVLFLRRLKEAGYTVDGAPTSVEELMAKAMARGRNLAPWAQGELESMVDGGGTVLVPVAQFERWLEKKVSKEGRADLEKHFGPAPGKLMVVQRNGQAQIVLPILRFGNVILAPQPERGAKQDRALLHSREVPPPYNYLAFYFWLEEEFHADVISHFGTHGSLELLPGKEAGLAPGDWGDVCLGSMPVVNLWIMDNLGEASLSRRRSYAALVDHLPPPAVEAGLHDELRALHEDIHKYDGLEEGVLKREFLKRITDKMFAAALDRCLEPRPEPGTLLTPAQVEDLGRALHEIEETTTPSTLHVLGTPPAQDLMAPYLVSCLRGAFVEAVEGLHPADHDEDEDHAHEEAHDRAVDWVEKAVLRGETAPPALEPFIEKGRRIHGKLLQADREVTGLLRGLDGRYVLPGPGPDPIRNPASIPGGRNLYGLNPEEIPTRPSWEVAKTLVEALLAHRRPEKVGIDLNGMNTMRDFGVMEGQILYLLGVEPVWDENELVIDVKLIPRQTLGRPRVDVFVALGGTYKENFPSRVKLLDKAVRLASRAEEADNQVRAGTRAQERSLVSRGFSEARAKALSFARIFGTKPGEVSGTKILDLVPRSGAWEDDDEITSVYLDSMGYVYTGDIQGERIDGLYESAVQRTDTILRVWASNMTSQLSNHHAYEYLGGLSMAVKALTGREPSAFIADVRDPDGARMRTFEEVLTTNLHSELLNRRWIEGMQEHDYAGAGMMSELVKNTFGWDVTRSSSVSEAVWGEIDEIYLKDRYELGLADWFQKVNPHALQEITATMLEAIRKGLWNADDATRKRLSRLFAESVVRDGPSAGLVTGGNRPLEEEVRKALDAPGDRNLATAFTEAMTKSRGESPQEAKTDTESVVGPKLVETRENTSSGAVRGQPDLGPWRLIGVGLVILALAAWGYARKWGGLR